MPSTAQTAETKAFENVRATPFTRIHGCPSWSDYEIPKQEAATIASEVEDIIYAWSRDATTGDEYGLLGDILGADEYDHQTGIDTYVKETEPDTYDGTINDTNPHPHVKTQGRGVGASTHMLVHSERIPQGCHCKSS